MSNDLIMFSNFVERSTSLSEVTAQRTSTGLGIVILLLAKKDEQLGAQLFISRVSCKFDKSS